VAVTFLVRGLYATIEGIRALLVSDEPSTPWSPWC
jgi:hypothetical protein